MLNEHENFVISAAPKITLMAIIDLVNLVEQRLEDIREQNPILTASEFYFSGDSDLWSLITIQGRDGNVIQYEFIESETSWKRAEAVLEYNQASLEMVKVVVIVPDSVVADVLSLVRTFDGQGVLVSDYSAAGLIPRPLAY